MESLSSLRDVKLRAFVSYPRDQLLHQKGASGLARHPARYGSSREGILLGFLLPRGPVCDGEAAKRTALCQGWLSPSMFPDWEGYAICRNRVRGRGLSSRGDI